MEWMEDFEEAEPGHRHISHLFGVYPGNSITSLEHKAAAKVTLKRRLAGGGGHTQRSAQSIEITIKARRCSSLTIKAPKIIAIKASTLVVKPCKA